MAVGTQASTIKDTSGRLDERMPKDIIVEQGLPPHPGPRGDIGKAQARHRIRTKSKPEEQMQRKGNAAEETKKDRGRMPEEGQRMSFRNRL